MSATESAIQNVDPIVRSLLPGYVARREEEFVRIEDWCEAGSFAEIRLAAHNLSGSGGAYGLPELTRIGRELEGAAESADHDGVVRQLKVMREFLDRVRAELEQAQA